jgi:hypothetical protein
MPVFEVAIIKKPTRKEIEEGTGSEEWIMKPQFVLARDQSTAAIAAVKGPEAPQALDLNRAEVLVRPFA